MTNGADCESLSLTVLMRELAASTQSTSCPHSQNRHFEQAEPLHRLGVDFQDKQEIAKESKSRQCHVCSRTSSVSLMATGQKCQPQTVLLECLVNAMTKNCPANTFNLFNDFCGETGGFGRTSVCRSLFMNCPPTLPRSNLSAMYLLSIAP